MNPLVLGISGSPLPESDTDRAVRRVLDATGVPSEFVKLSDYRLEPCRACGSCAPDNQCHIDSDDGRAIAKRFLAARAFVIGGYTTYGSLDARTKTFIERMYCLRHLTGLNRGKIGAAVIMASCRTDRPDLPHAAQLAASQVAHWMRDEEMQNLGTLIVVGSVPCLRCGNADRCSMSGVRMLHGPSATVESVGAKRSGLDADIVEQAKVLGRKIREAILPAVAS
jgi:hypothetical protein